MSASESLSKVTIPELQAWSFSVLQIFLAASALPLLLLGLYLSVRQVGSRYFKFAVWMVTISILATSGAIFVIRQPLADWEYGLAVGDQMVVGEDLSSGVMQFTRSTFCHRIGVLPFAGAMEQPDPVRVWLVNAGLKRSKPRNIVYQLNGSSLDNPITLKFLANDSLRISCPGKPVFVAILRGEKSFKVILFFQFHIASTTDLAFALSRRQEIIRTNCFMENFRFDGTNRLDSNRSH
ncbi:hypothetical protein Ciccas_007540 [Cichlidogyrus casuarinus]|uniref:Uncharacterized protein n=1 Tax=Cichlidogyrus casuarinus TaxID=1844966 RepID=A0ABD2Q401_9PLAT